MSANIYKGNLTKREMKGVVIATLLLIFGLVSIGLTSAASVQEINYSASSNTYTTPTFMVNTLKYEPYPVNAGDWFDLWVKVQNVGQDDAPNVRLELVPDYPFSSNESLVKDFGLINGKISAFKISTDYDATQIVTKFRVKVEDSAPEGTSNIKLNIISDKDVPGAGGVSYSLPIIIAKTKSDFNIVMQDITPQGTSFMITNIGQNPVSSVVVSVKPQEGLSVLGPMSQVIGDLDKGDFTIAHLQVLPGQDVKSLTMEVAYTDQSGTRIVSERNIPIEIPNKLSQICQSNAGSYVKWIYGIVGLFIGVILIIVLRSLEKKLSR